MEVSVTKGCSISNKNRTEQLLQEMNYPGNLNRAVSIPSDGFEQFFSGPLWRVHHRTWKPCGPFFSEVKLLEPSIAASVQTVWLFKWSVVG